MRDQIRDFSRGEGDRIDVSAIDADAFSAGNQRFSFLGSENFTGQAGQLRYQHVSTGTIVEADTNGDGVADFQIHSLRKVSFVALDFIL
jgi:serralysin